MSTTSEIILSGSFEKPISLCVFYWPYDQVIFHEIELDVAPKYTLVNDHICVSQNVFYKLYESNTTENVSSIEYKSGTFTYRYSPLTACKYEKLYAYSYQYERQ